MENIFIILLGLSMIYIASTSRLLAHVNTLVAQGWILFFICVAGFANEPWFSVSIFSDKNTFIENIPHFLSLLFVIFETLLVKVYHKSRSRKRKKLHVTKDGIGEK